MEKILQIRLVVIKDAESYFNTKHFHNVGDMWPLEQNDMVKCRYHACTCMSHCIYWNLYVISVNAVHGSSLFSDGSGWGCHTPTSIYSRSSRKQYSVSWGKFPQIQLIIECIYCFEYTNTQAMTCLIADKFKLKYSDAATAFVNKVCIISKIKLLS